MFHAYVRVGTGPDSDPTHHMIFIILKPSDAMAEVKDDPEITLETYDKHHVKVAKSIATRSAIINMMIDGMHCCFFSISCASC